MRHLLLLAITVYWVVIPPGKRRKCLFRTTCSQYVFQITREKGFYKGLTALKFRFLNCRSGYHIFDHAVDGSKMMILPNGQGIPETEIAERLLK